MIAENLSDKLGSTHPQLYKLATDLNVQLKLKTLRACSVDAVFVHPGKMGISFILILRILINNQRKQPQQGQQNLSNPW